MAVLVYSGVVFAVLLAICVVAVWADKREPTRVSQLPETCQGDTHVFHTTCDCGKTRSKGG